MINDKSKNDKKSLIQLKTDKWYTKDKYRLFY